MKWQGTLHAIEVARALSVSIPAHAGVLSQINLTDNVE